MSENRVYPCLPPRFMAIYILFPGTLLSDDTAYFLERASSDKSPTKPEHEDRTPVLGPFQWSGIPLLIKSEDRTALSGYGY